MFNGKTPDLTPAQLVTIVGAVIAVAVAFGLSITEDQKLAVLGLVTVLGGLLLHSDKGIRQARAENADRILIAKKAAHAVKKADAEK